MFKKEPPVVFDHLDYSSIWVCCPQNRSENIIEEEDVDYRYVKLGCVISQGDKITLQVT